MNPAAIALVAVCAIGLFAVPRKWAPAPLLLGCCYMTMGQGIDLGPISLPVYRILLALGLVRALTRGERFHGGCNTIDKLMAAWAAWVMFASFFHTGEDGSGPVYASGIIFNVCSVYALTRMWCRDTGEIKGIIVILALLLAPIALEMMLERSSGRNLFGVFGGVPFQAAIRGDEMRAQGPFRHPILAGTVGATAIPLFVGIWKSHRPAAWLGLISGWIMVVTSESSGPIMSALAGGTALLMWRFRHLTNLARAAGVAIYFLFGLFTGEPGYYIMKRIDLSGGSTGWHRARLIESSVEHLGEWWLFGTDFTRHWMATGVSYSPNHTDITNYYLGFGVIGGLASVLLVIAMLAVAFLWVGKVCRMMNPTSPGDAFFVWCLGSAMFAHAATGVSVSYFDQSMVFFWMTLAMISSMYSSGSREPVRHQAAQDTPSPVLTRSWIY